MSIQMSIQNEIAVFFTGGTIGMSPVPGRDGVAPGGNFERLLAEPLPDGGRVSVRAVEWSDKPSPHMSPADMMRLSRDIDAVLAEDSVLGAVVLHGTDTLVESAFLCDLTLSHRKPVVFTGSMRYYTESGYDGLRNLFNALRTVLLPLPAEAGVALLMTDRVFAAREAVKVNSLNIDAFESRETGVLAHVAGEDVVLLRGAGTMEPGPRFTSGRIEEHVPLITCYTGMDGTLLRHARESGAAGLVLEGFGAGNVPPGILDDLDACLGAGMPVVLATRCIEGGVWPIYGYPGGAADLRERGVILCGRLGGPKARILLMCALAETQERAEVAGYFAQL